jgi:hypothetical protein
VAAAETTDGDMPGLAGRLGVLGAARGRDDLGLGSECPGGEGDQGPAPEVWGRCWGDMGGLVYLGASWISDCLRSWVCGLIERGH